MTNSLDHKITAAFSFHRFLCAGQFTTPTGSTFNPTIHMALGDISWHLTQPARGLNRPVAEAQSCSYPGLLMHPALQLNVMILEGYHRSQSCWDTPLPITGWPPTVQCGVQMATLQGSPSGWIYQATLYNTQFLHWGCNHHCLCQHYLQLNQATWALEKQSI